MPGPSLDDVRAAHERIRHHVVRTPLIRLHTRATPPPPIAAGRGVLDMVLREDRLPETLYLKAESLQVSGSFKARGATSAVLALAPEVRARGVVTASGGNHGAAVAYAAHAAGAPATVFLPENTPEPKADRIRAWGARAVRAGKVWDDAHEAALAFAKEQGATYVHPFADAKVVAGQGTIAVEVLESAPECDLFVVAIGGGGLVAGVAAAARALSPGVRVVGVEPVGAPTLKESLDRGEVVTLPAITTRANTLAPRRSDAYVFDVVKRDVDGVVLVTDEEMAAAARWLLSATGLGAELSGAAALAAVLFGKVDLRGARAPCVLVCGAGDEALGAT